MKNKLILLEYGHETGLDPLEVILDRERSSIFYTDPKNYGNRYQKCKEYQ